MAETRKIVIEIKSTETSSSATPKPTETPTTESKKTKEDNLTLAKSVLLNQAINVAKRSLSNAVSTGIDRYLTLTEDYVAETSLQNAMVSINKMVSLAGTVYAGAKLGSVGGAVGSMIGMGVATVGWGINEVISYQARMSGYYRQLNASNITRAYATKRAGLIDNGRGTEN